AVPRKLLAGTRHASSVAATLQDIRSQLMRYQAGTVELTKDSDTGIAVLTLNNPGKKNALSGSMMVELADHVTALGQWKEGKGVILTGADNAFCSGGDLKTVAAILNSHDGERMSEFMHDSLTRLHALPLISLALLQGVALGGGAELATACDFRVMTPKAKVGFVQVKMGVTTGWGGATRLFKLLGRRRALDLLSSGRLLDTEEAHSIGFADHIILSHAGDTSLEEAKTLLQDQYCCGQVQLVRAVKRMVTKLEASQTLSDALEHERTIFASFWGGELQKAALEKNIKHS
ncbi:hypothetical protein BaRGS_00021240, partial [Batillaria attramentaria]